MNPKSNLLQWRAVRTKSSWMYMLHTVCDVIIARSCGTLPAPAAIIFLLTLECVMQLWIRLCLKTVVYFNLRLDRNLDIRIQRNWVATLQLLFLLCKASSTNLFEIHRWSWTSGVHFSISAGGGNFVFWPSQPRVRQLSSAQRTLHLEVCDEVIHIYKLKQV